MVKVDDDDGDDDAVGHVSDPWPSSVWFVGLRARARHEKSRDLSERAMTDRRRPMALMCRGPRVRHALDLALRQRAMAKLLLVGALADSIALSLYISLLST